MNNYLEIRCEQVIISPGLEMELLIEDIEGALPVNILYREGSLQIYPCTSNPDWLVLFKGKEIVPGYPTRLSEH